MKPDVFKTHDYREYLTGWIEYQRQTHPAFSLRSFAKLVGIAPSLLTMILKKERRMTDSVFLQITAAMNLTKPERETLRLLRVIGECEGHEERMQAFRALAKIPQYREKHREAHALFEYLTDWRNVAIRELAFQRDFSDSSEWIQSRFRHKTSLSSIDKSLMFLKINGFLIQEENGRWIPQSRQNLNCDEGIFRLSLGQFHRQMLQLAQEAIELVPRSERYIVGHTISLDMQQRKEAERILSEALKKIEALKKTESAPNKVNHQEVVHFEFTCIPLTLNPERTDS